VGGMILEILGGGIGMNTMNFNRHCDNPWKRKSHRKTQEEERERRMEFVPDRSEALSETTALFAENWRNGTNTKYGETVRLVQGTKEEISHGGIVVFSSLRFGNALCRHWTRLFVPNAFLDVLDVGGKLSGQKPSKKACLRKVTYFQS